MSASASTATKLPIPRFQREAESCIDILLDLGLAPAVNLSTEELLFALSREPTSPPDPAAIRIAGILSNRFQDDADYREDAISYIGSVGFYLAEAPGIRDDLKTAGPKDLVHAVHNAGLTPIMLLGESGGAIGLAFRPSAGRPAHNLHLLVDLLNTRCRDDLAFYTGVYAYLSSLNWVVFDHSGPAAA